MSQHYQAPHASYFILTLDEINILLDALKEHITEIDRNPTYDQEEKCFALLHSAHVLGTIQALYRQTTEQGHPAILRYQLVPGDPTISRHRLN